MKILVILAASTRGGIDFFQSLLDKHPEISQLPGEFYVDEFLQKIKKNSSAEIIANKFIEMHQRYFDSSISITERHNSLGPNKNQSYKVDKKLFIKFFLNFLKKKKINTKNIIIYLHLAYSKASGEDIKKKNY